MAKSKGGVTVAKVQKLCEPIIAELGLRLWDVRYEKEGADWQRVSRAINTPLDELDPIEGAYCLEVCSPGIERELIRDEHFEQFIGADIMVKLLRPVEGIGREFNGVLTAYENGEVTITDHSGENQMTINKKEAAWIKLDDFD